MRCNRARWQPVSHLSVDGGATTRSFSAFGVAIAEHGSGSRFGFGGYPLDDVTGLSFASSRYYDASTASFTQGDTWLYGFDSPEVLNGYAYAANSP